jgi:hypothetical protein
MRKGRLEGLKPADPSRIWPDPTACAASHQAGGRPERVRPSATAWIHRPRRAKRPHRRPIPQPQDHRNSSPPSAVRHQGRRASRRVVGARRLPKPAAQKGPAAGPSRSCRTTATAHRRAPCDARAAAQAGESSEHGVFPSLPRTHHRVEETSSDLRSAGAAARRH